MRPPSYIVQSSYLLPKFVGNWWAVGEKQWIDLRRISHLADIGGRSIVIKYESSERLRKIEGVSSTYFEVVVNRWRRIRAIDKELVAKHGKAD